MSAIAIIPARGGSKRIPKKNIMLLEGIPSIAYPINIAIESGLFDRVIVSTDDQEIAELSTKLGAEVPTLRTKELSDDFAVTTDVIADSVFNLKEKGNNYDFVCCIYPVTPLLRIERLKEAYKIIELGDWDYVFPAIEFSSPIERGFTKRETGVIDFRFPEFAKTRTQDLSKTFHDAGQFYFGKFEAWLTKQPILTGNSTFIELDKYETFDVDNLSDWKLVEKIVRLNKNNV
jgi:pseudaminic acid cytidylyltransferase